MSTVLSKLNAFLDTELEQVICFDGGIDAELFVRERCAIFLILPEEDAAKNFVASLMIQNLARELFSVANEHGGRLPNRAVFFCDELGTMPPFDILPLFSAGRSRRLTLVPIIQSLAQLEKNYGKEGSEILCDNCQDISLRIMIPYHPAERPVEAPNGYDGTYYPNGLEGVPKRFRIAKANRLMIDTSDWLIAYVCHGASNSRKFLEYAERREKKGLLQVQNIAEIDA